MAKKRIIEQYDNVTVDADEEILVGLHSDEFQVFDLGEIFEKLDGKIITLTIEYNDPIHCISVEKV